MGCRYHTEEEEKQIILKKLHNVTNMLCSLMGELELKKIDINKGTVLYNWWEEHKELDRQRNNEAKDLKIKEEERTLFISKLTEREKALLNIKE